MSWRVTSSEYMPPVCSNRARRRPVSRTPKRSAMPGSHQTGSTAILVTVTSPASARSRRPPAAGRARSRPGSRGGVRRAFVIAMEGRMSIPSAMSSSVILRDAMAPGIERHDLAGLAPLLVRADLADRGGVVEVRAGGRVHRPGGDGERAVDGIGAAMGHSRRMSTMLLPAWFQFVLFISLAAAAPGVAASVVIGGLGAMGGAGGVGTAGLGGAGGAAGTGAEEAQVAPSVPSVAEAQVAPAVYPERPAPQEHQRPVRRVVAPPAPTARPVAPGTAADEPRRCDRCHRHNQCCLHGCMGPAVAVNPAAGGAGAPASASR